MTGMRDGHQPGRPAVLLDLLRTCSFIIYEDGKSSRASSIMSSE